MIHPTTRSTARSALSIGSDVTGRAFWESVRLAALVALVVFVLPAVTAGAQIQQSESTAQEARDELAVATELGRLFGAITRMHRTRADLALGERQVAELRDVTEQIRALSHLPASRAGEMIETVREAILESAQREYLAQRSTGGTGSSQQTESAGASGGSPDASDRGAGSQSAPAGRGAAGAGSGAASADPPGDSAQIAAGPSEESAAPSNPLLDSDRQIGRLFQEFRSLLEASR